MRKIDISTDVFARIWAMREQDEDSEDAILRRVLWQRNFDADSDDLAQPPDKNGIFDRRNRVHFPEEFEIERTYLGQKFHAIVRGGQWTLNGRVTNATRLNELSREIGTNTENAWLNWFYRDENGVRRRVSDKRDKSRVVRRTAKRIKKMSEFEGGISSRKNVRWCDDVYQALKTLGGEAPLASIYAAVEARRRSGGRSVPPTLPEVVRKELEVHSSDSDAFGGDDWFAMAAGKGNGIWALRDK